MQISHSELNPLCEYFPLFSVQKQIMQMLKTVKISNLLIFERFDEMQLLPHSTNPHPPKVHKIDDRE